MHLKRLMLAAGALALLVPVVIAGLAFAGSTRSDTALASQATAAYHDLGAAQRAGYAAVVQDLAGNTCIAQEGAGAMGVHYLNPALLDDSIDATSPEALVYGPGPNSQLRLVALEYLVFQAAWDATHGAPPSLFGEQFMLTPSPNRYGIPAFYALHAWIWNPNPSGMFSPWNPRVSCG
jgi:hypothetical protein